MPKITAVENIKKIIKMYAYSVAEINILGNRTEYRGTANGYIGIHSSLYVLKQEV